MKNSYDDIINMPHHVSSDRAHMSPADRAAQFSPFAALTGYEAAIRETARLTEEKIEMDEESKAVLDRQVQILLEKLGENPQVSITYFKPDEKKSGGAYVTVTGIVKKVDDYAQNIVMVDGDKIPIGDILCMEGELFSGI